MLQYYLRMEPQLFHAAVDQQLQRLKEEKDAKEAAVRKSQEEESSTPERTKSDLVLYQRMEEVSRLNHGRQGGTQSLTMVVHTRAVVVCAGY